MIELDDLIGKPHRKGGRGPDAFDCWGVVLEILRRSYPGRPLPDWASDQMTARRQREEIALQAPIYCELIPWPRPGCLLISEAVGHIGILIYGRVIHAQKISGVVASRPADFLAVLPDVRAYTWRA